MQINKQRVKTERECRAWSQNQLADIAGLSIRTVQRVETAGTGSYETIQALASALDLGIDDLRHCVSDKDKPAPIRFKKLLRLMGSGLTGAVLAFVGIFVFMSVQAQEILLDMDYTNGGKSSAPFSIADDLNTEMEFSIDDEFRVTITPTLTKSQNILLVFNVYQRRQGEYHLISQPKIITANQQQAEIIVNHHEADELAVRITPYYGLL